MNWLPIGIVVLALLLVLAAMGWFVLTLAMNWRKPSWLSVGSGLVFAALGAWLGLKATPSVLGLAAFAMGALALTGALVGCTRWLRGRWITVMLWASALVLASLWSATGAVVLRPRAPRFIEPLAGTPAGCPYYDRETSGVRSSLADAPFEAEVAAGWIHLHAAPGHSVELARPVEPFEPQYLSCEESPVLVGDRGDGEYCVGYDPGSCRGYVDPHVVFVDRALRFWPHGALSLVEARCGTLVERWLELAFIATLALALFGAWRSRRWNALLANVDRRSGRWQGTLEQSADGWILMADGQAHTLDLRRARVLGGKLVEGECRVLAKASGRDDPYRASSALRVVRIASGDGRSIRERIWHERVRAWGLVLVVIAPIALPVLAAVLAAYQGL